MCFPVMCADNWYCLFWPFKGVGLVEICVTELFKTVVLSRFRCYDCTNHHNQTQLPVIQINVVLEHLIGLLKHLWTCVLSKVAYIEPQPKTIK